jgi:two-component system, NtrC family, response regulator AtoC
VAEVHEATVEATGRSASFDSVSLVFIGPELVQSAALHEGGSLLVGRMPPADVLLADPTISRQHARISLQQGVLLIEDAGSRNGVLVNGAASARAVVADSDRVRIGAIDVLAWRAPHPTGRDIRELSALRFVARLSEELERARYSQRPVWLCAVRWPTRTPAPEQLVRAHEALRSIDRFCVHAPHITLSLLLECDAAAARATAEAVRKRAGSSALTALVAAPPRAANADALVAAAIDLVQRDVAADGIVMDQAEIHVPLEAPIVLGAQTRRLFELAARTGHADLPVLVLGETGAGKEVLARAFHEHSRRAEAPFCEVSCAAIAPSLVESILFGHERGAFTGADKRAAGLLEQAHGGTLFLDEIGELSHGAQSALLRALEVKRVRRVGAAQEIAVDVRVIAATNRNLRELVAAGGFRADLLYRLEALTVRVPPLRERGDEIEPLAQLFLRNAARKWAAPARSLSEPARHALVTYAWPGNVRELRNAIERAVAVCASEIIELSDLPEHLAQAYEQTRNGSVPAPEGTALSLPEAVRKFESARIAAALAKAGGNRSQAARLLGLPRRTLGSKLRDYGLE